MNTKGFSLMETLIVIGIFAVIGVIVTSSIADSIRGTKKSDATIRLRSNLELSLATIERRVRNAKELSPCVAGVQMKNFSYTDQDNTTHSFSCGGGVVSIDGQDITSQEINITTCTFVCTPPSVGLPASLDITLSGEDLLSSGEQSANFSTKSKLNLRSY